MPNSEVTHKRTSRHSQREAQGALQNECRKYGKHQARPSVATKFIMLTGCDNREERQQCTTLSQLGSQRQQLTNIRG